MNEVEMGDHARRNEEWTSLTRTGRAEWERGLDEMSERGSVPIFSQSR